MVRLLPIVIGSPAPLADCGQLSASQDLTSSLNSFCGMNHFLKHINIQHNIYGYESQDQTTSLIISLYQRTLFNAITEPPIVIQFFELRIVSNAFNCRFKRTCIWKVLQDTMATSIIEFPVLVGISSTICVDYRQFFALAA
jgi:hypothetical protein